MNGLPELQDAVRKIPGIATARIRWPDPDGPATLRVEFEADADHVEVGEAVIRTLVEVGDVDLATLHLERDEQATWSSRPVFTTLLLDRVDGSLTVEVGLSIGGHDVIGSATAPDVRGGELRAVAEAALDGLRRVDHTHPYAIDHVEAVSVGVREAVNVVVTSDADGTSLLGSALVVRDPREATVRATLDAVNRHFELSRTAATVDLT